MKSFEIDLDHERSLVRITASGDLFREDGEEIITAARTVAAQHGYSVLYDVRKATPRVPLARWFHLPRELDVFKQPKTRLVRAAVLIPADVAVDAYRFYELVVQNLGLSLRIFFEEAEAIAWLEGQSAPTDGSA